MSRTTTAHLFCSVNDGRVGDRQVVSADWVAQATAQDTSSDPAEH